MNQDRAGSPLRLALVQFKPRKGDVSGNLVRMRKVLADESGHADVVVFPEAAPSGYFLEGGVAEAALTTDVASQIPFDTSIQTWTAFYSPPTVAPTVAPTSAPTVAPTVAPAVAPANGAPSAAVAPVAPVTGAVPPPAR